MKLGLLASTLLILVLLATGYYLINNINAPTPASSPSTADNSLTKVLNSKELRVGSALEELPWGSIDKDTGKEIGGEVEIAKMVADSMGVKLTLINKGFEYLLPELLNKQFDVAIAGLSITEERQKLVAFTNPYLTTGLVILVHQTNDSIQGVSDLANKKVGVLSGTTSHEFVSALKDVEIRVYDNPGDYIKDTISGEIGATVYDATAAHGYLKSHPELKIAGPLLNKESYGMALRKEDRELLAKLNEVIAKLRESEDFKATLANWYGPTE